MKKAKMVRALKRLPANRLLFLAKVERGLQQADAGNTLSHAKVKQKLRKRIGYTDEPVGKLRVVEDFLPPPSELAFREEGVKVTMVLSKSSVDFFKRAAAKYHAPYHEMIRELVDAYASRYPMP